MARSLCSFIGSALLPSFSTLCLAGIVALLTKIVHADIALGATYRKCSIAEFIEACVGLRAADTYANCIKAATLLPLHYFVVDLRERLHAVWRELDGTDPHIGHMLKNWLLIMHGWPCLSKNVAVC